MNFPNGTQISPCIVSKVRHALIIKTDLPHNGKRCSKTYWDNVCEVVASIEGNRTRTQINTAKNRFEYYMNL